MIGLAARCAYSGIHNSSLAPARISNSNWASKKQYFSDHAADTPNNFLFRRDFMQIFTHDANRSDKRNSLFALICANSKLRNFTFRINFAVEATQTNHSAKCFGKLQRRHKRNVQSKILNGAEHAQDTNDRGQLKCLLNDRMRLTKIVSSLDTFYSNWARRHATWAATLIVRQSRISSSAVSNILLNFVWKRKSKFIQNFSIRHTFRCHKSISSWLSVFVCERQMNAINVLYREQSGGNPESINSIKTMQLIPGSVWIIDAERLFASMSSK